MLQLNENKQFAFFQRLAFPLRIFLLILVFSIFVIAALAQYFTASFEDYLTLHVRDMAMNQAKIIASNDSVISAVKTRDYKRLATIANKLQRDTDFDYVVMATGTRSAFTILIRRKLVILCSSPNTGRAGERGELLHYRERVNGDGDARQNANL